MIRKPPFISPIQRVKAGAIRFASLSLQSAAPDGCYPVDAFKPGFAEMAEDDWRQFEMTPENAAKMCQQANADIASGRPEKQLRMNYGHDRSGPVAGKIMRAELTPEGGVRSMVKWTDPAQASIRAGEWEGTSPEFLAQVVLDENGTPVETNGRVLMRPFALTGGALDNDPAMPELELAATVEAARPDVAKEEIMNKKLAAMLGLPETASAEDVEKALEAKLNPKAPPPAAGDPSPATIEAVAAKVLAAIKPDDLAKAMREAAVKDAREATRLESAEKASIEAVDAAILAGRVKKSERESALKLARVDVEAFKTMTATMKLVAPVTAIYKPGENPTGAAGEEAHTVRHRFDIYGPAVLAASTDPAVQDFAEGIRWIAAHEAAGNPKFKNPTEAFQAFRAAQPRQKANA